jgi:hypothetical protein
MVADPPEGADHDQERPDLAEENAGDGGDLSPTQEQAIIALLNEQTLGRAAAAAKVGQRTLFRWLRQPAFSRAYRQARRDAFGQAIALTQRYAPLAVNTLAQVMMDKAAPHHAKVSAATTLLRFGREGIELDDLAARVEALEKAPPQLQQPASSGRRWGEYR